MGFKKGLIHIYIKNGNIDQIARRICSLDSIESVRIRIGNDTMDKFDSQVGLGHLKLIHARSQTYTHRISSRRGIDLLMEYEESLPAKLDLNVKILCLYPIRDFDILKQPDQMEYLLKLHFRRYKIKVDPNPYDKASYNNKSISTPCL
jgi:hypothetical protein